MSGIPIEMTINIRVPTDDGVGQMIGVKSTVNWDHIRMIAPRTEGGSLVTFADRAQVVCAENRAELNQKICNRLLEKSMIPVAHSEMVAELRDLKKDPLKEIKGIE